MDSTSLGNGNVEMFPALFADSNGLQDTQVVSAKNLLRMVVVANNGHAWPGDFPICIILGTIQFSKISNNFFFEKRWK